MNILNILEDNGFMAPNADEIYFKCLGDVKYMLRATNCSVVEKKRGYVQSIELGLSKKKGEKFHLSLYYQDFDLLTKKKKDMDYLKLGYVVANENGLGDYSFYQFAFLKFLPMKYSGYPVSVLDFLIRFGVDIKKESYISDMKIKYDWGQLEIEVPKTLLYGIVPECLLGKRDHTFKLSKSFIRMHDAYGLDRAAFSFLVNAFVSNRSVCSEHLKMHSLSRQTAMKVYKDLISSDKIIKSSLWDHLIKTRCKSHVPIDLRIEQAERYSVKSKKIWTVQEILILYANLKSQRKKEFLQSGKNVYKTKKVN